VTEVVRPGRVVELSRPGPDLPRRRIMPRIVASLGAACVVVAASPTSAIEDQSDPVARGQAIAEQLCARCHAISGSGPSPVPAAPLFSRFEQKWPVEYLEEALAEGLVAGHGPVRMPEFVFWPDEIHDLLAYLKSVQE
jgi:mono/diheme cytochrome c family protein